MLRTVIRVSAGTAAVLGLEQVKLDVAPTTAYLMAGQKCTRNCAFCSQARTARSRADLLSRVTWPEFPREETAARIATAYAKGDIQRACIQVVAEPHVQREVLDAISCIKAHSPVPLCVSVSGSKKSICELLEAGADRVSIALDAACENVYRQVKGDDWARTYGLLQEVNTIYPGRVGTHIIVGLGETDGDVISTVLKLYDSGISVALFAFTPIKGTALEGAPQPSIERYRAIQAALFLLRQDLSLRHGFQLDGDRLVSIGLSEQALERGLISGDAFRTSGCLGCNRPFYNEKPGGDMYNYPRHLSASEAEHCITQVVSYLSHSGGESSESKKPLARDL